MKITVVLFSYNRPDMLLQSLKHLVKFKDMLNVIVLDDASHFDSKEHELYCDVFDRNKKNVGKKGFYKQWKKAFRMCQNNPSDIYLFAPDDFLSIDINKVIKMHQVIQSKFRTAYAFNIINCGRKQCWTPFQPHRIGINGEQLTELGFVDCGFFCNTQTLKRLEFRIDKTPDVWFDRPTKSSGVGWQLSKRMYNLKVKMFQPVKSYAFHGDHQSVMHPNERIKNPLISR